MNPGSKIFKNSDFAVVYPAKNKIRLQEANLQKQKGQQAPSQKVYN